MRLLGIDGGDIRFRGESIGGLSARRFRRYRQQIQIVFQEPFESLNPLRSVAATLEEPLKALTELTGAERQARVHEVLGEVGLTAASLAARPGELSAGDSSAWRSGGR